MSEQMQSSCRALVPLAPQLRQQTAPGIGKRANAAFVTQILAHALDLPSQRRLRRATPLTAVRLYSGTTSHDPRFVTRVDRTF